MVNERDYRRTATAPPEPEQWEPDRHRRVGQLVDDDSVPATSGHPADETSGGDREETLPEVRDLYVVACLTKAPHDPSIVEVATGELLDRSGDDPSESPCQRMPQGSRPRLNRMASST
jgi:hypothetical protein